MKKNQIMNGATGGEVLPKALALIAALAIAGLAFGAREYGKRSSGEQADANAAAMDDLLEISQTCQKLHFLNVGDMEQAKQELSLRLAEDVKQLRASMAMADKVVSNRCQTTLRAILRDQHAHPEFYLTTSPQARLHEARAWEAVGSDALASDLRKAGNN
ncbi:MAG TPA: hypothetical protein VH598_14685 [Verrucomicrobiae bacterium]|nr:hypothetical protein [Verrucomicrobiae bacterium]